MNVGVTMLGRRVERIFVAERRALERWPMHGLIGVIAWRFNGRKLELVRLSTLDRPSARSRA